MKKILKNVISVLIVIILFGTCAVSGLVLTDDCEISKAQAVSDYQLIIETKFFGYDENGGEWIETERVAPGEEVKVRVFVGTNYYAGPSDFIFFYDNKAFEDGLDVSEKFNVTVNDDYGFEYECQGVKHDSTNSWVKKMVSQAVITEEFSESNNVYNTIFSYSNGGNSQILNIEKWLFEYDFKVKSDFTGEACFIVLPQTIISPENISGRIDVTVDKTGGSYSDCVSMSNIAVDSTVTSATLKSVVERTVTYDAAEGAFLNGDKIRTYVYESGMLIEEEEYPVKEGYVFTGWSPAVPDVMPDADMIFTAVFAKSYLCPDCGFTVVGENEINIHIEFETRAKASVKIKNNSGSRTIDFGETLRLTALVSNKLDDTEICWYVNGVEKGRGDIFEVSPSSGSIEVTVKLIDSDGTVLRDANNNEISDTQKVSVNSGLFKKIISFFKNLFRANRTIIQVFDSIL